MTNSTLKKRILKAAIACFAYFGITIFYYHIDKYLTGAPFIILTLLVPVIFIWIIVYFIKDVINIYKNRASRNFTICLPAIICGITLLYTCFSPYRLDSEKLESKEIIHAFFKGTQNQAVLRFRANKTFELNWTGVFGYDEWFTGTYTQNQDTLYLDYKKQKPARFGSKILLKDESLTPLDKPVDTTLYVTFYIKKQVN